MNYSNRFSLEVHDRAVSVVPERRHPARRRNLLLISQRAKRDATLVEQFRRVWNANPHVYSVDKVSARITVVVATIRQLNLYSRAQIAPSS
jgi:hypothetical protein